MKRKLLLYLSRSQYQGNIAVASTLAWLSKTGNHTFDNYYDTYHEGIHFPGGDFRELEVGKLSGGTVSGDRHFEEFYFILLNFDVRIVATPQSLFLSNIRNLNIPVVVISDKINELYKEVFAYFAVPLPPDIVMIGSNFGEFFSGIDTYLYPEIFYRQALGVPESIPEDQLADLYRDGRKLYCLYVRDDVITRLRGEGYNIEIIDQLSDSDDYLSVTKRMALRWEHMAKGWILGDPVLVSHWLPKGCDENLIAIYSVPQQRILSQEKKLISSTGKVIYGRQYSDHDFFEISKLDQCFQVIDPYRPPFQSVRHVDYSWNTANHKTGFYDEEFSDEELQTFAREGRVLASLFFWSGMIRETANLYNLMDLFAMTRLRAGLVLTAQTYEYMMHSALELLTIPLEQGGVFPLVEPVLGSCGVGVGIEFHLTQARLMENLEEALSRIVQKVKNDSYMPRGWWTTMDADLREREQGSRPKPVCFLKYPPYFQIRFHQKDEYLQDTSVSRNKSLTGSLKHWSVSTIRRWVRRYGLSKYFMPYRPYEFYQPGPIRQDIAQTAKSAGLRYMFTKAGFNADPQAHYMDDHFIALNYTAGRWDGWTPFETVNDVSDLSKAEQILLKKRKPGWIASTIDSCLWTSGGEFWKRGTELYEIAEFCANGGKSGKLINVKPFTVARYARILAKERS